MKHNKELKIISILCLQMMMTRTASLFTLTQQQKQQQKQISPMFGAVVGDIAGSTYERRNCKSESCEIFARGSRPTDDSILTLATAKRFLTLERQYSYTDLYQQAGRAYPNAGYGKGFARWLSVNEEPKAYNSWGNGSAMRTSPIAWAAPDLKWALEEAAVSAAVTHNHPLGIKGAQALTAGVFLARHGSSKNEIRQYIQEHFSYDLQPTLAEIRPSYTFDVSCEGSVPQAIIAFLESRDFEDAIRKAISLGGDSDTIASMAGALAHGFYGTIPSRMIEYCRDVMDANMLTINDQFWSKYLEGNLSPSPTLPQAPHET